MCCGHCTGYHAGSRLQLLRRVRVRSRSSIQQDLAAWKVALGLPLQSQDVRLGGKCLPLWLSAFGRQVSFMVLENFGLQMLDQLVQVEAESRIHERAPQVVPELGLVLKKSFALLHVQ